jgi:hypothetical protein
VYTNEYAYLFNFRQPLPLEDLTRGLNDLKEINAIRTKLHRLINYYTVEGTEMNEVGKCLNYGLTILSERVKNCIPD